MRNFDESFFSTSKGQIRKMSKMSKGHRPSETKLTVKVSDDERFSGRNELKSS